MSENSSLDTAPAAAADGSLAPFAIGEQARHVLAFLKRPRLPERAAGFGAEGLLAVLRLWAIDLGLMGILVAIAAAAMAAGFAPPGNVFDDLELTWPIVLAIVIAAPLIEEIAFRGWLSGRPGHVLAVVLLVGGALLSPVLAGENVVIGTALFGVFLVGAIGAIWAFRASGPMGWFVALFPALFWLATLAFAAIHLLNYEEGNFLAMLPLVLPQFIAGALFGYARVTHGLWASMLLHALHNGAIIALVLAGMAFGG